MCRRWNGPIDFHDVNALLSLDNQIYLVSHRQLQCFTLYQSTIETWVEVNVYFNSFNMKWRRLPLKLFIHYFFASLFWFWAAISWRALWQWIVINTKRPKRTKGDQEGTKKRPRRDQVGTKKSTRKDQKRPKRDQYKHSNFAGMLSFYFS